METNIWGLGVMVPLSRWNVGYMGSYYNMRKAIVYLLKGGLYLQLLLAFLQWWFCSVPWMGSFFYC